MCILPINIPVIDKVVERRKVKALLDLFIIIHVHVGKCIHIDKVFALSEKENDSNTLDECDQETLVQVRANIEALIEGFIGSSLDQAHVNKPYKSREYDQLVSHFQPALALAILQLTEALFLSMQNQPFVNGNIPTSAHTRLKNLILALIDSASTLPHLQLDSELSATGIDLDDSKTYEDLLAMAIMNELVKIQQNRLSMNDCDTHRVGGNVFPTSESKQCIERKEIMCSKNEKNVTGVVDDDEHDDAIDDEEVGIDYDDDDDGHSKDSNRTMDTGIHSRSEEIIYHSDSQITNPMDDGDSQKKCDISSLLADKEADFKIEEKIEEITTTKWDSDGEADDGLGYHNRITTSDLDQYGLDLNFNCTGKVPFPEMGMDLVDIYGDGEEEEEGEDKDGDEKDRDDRLNKAQSVLSSSFGVKVIDCTCWEENWLFQRKKKADNDYVPQYCMTNLDQALNPVCMTIPNPSQIVHPSVGSVCIDELSDLSEHNSIESIEYSTTTTTSEDEESTTNTSDDSKNFDQQQQHTSATGLRADMCTAKDFALKSKTTVDVTKLSKLCPLSVPSFVPPHKRSETSSTVTDYGMIHQQNNHDINNCVKSTEIKYQLPHFTLLPQSASSIQSNILVQFCCRARGTQQLAVAWYRNGQLIPSNDNDYRCFKDFNDHILEIKRTNRELSGQYTCCVYNHYGAQWTDFDVNISDRVANRDVSKHFKSRFANHHHRPSLKSGENGSSKKKTSSEQEADDIGTSPTTSEIEELLGNRRGRRMTLAEQEIDKWNHPTSEPWPENPYTSENLEKRKHMNLFLDSLDKESESAMTADQEEENLCALPYITPSKNLGRFKRDYYVSVDYKKDEALNALEEKAYSCSIYYSPDRTPPEENPDLEVQVNETKVLSDRIGPKSEETSPIAETVAPVVLKSDLKHQIRTRTSSSIGNDEMIVASPQARSTATTTSSYSFSHRHGNGSGPVVSVKNLISRFSDSKEKMATGGTESSIKQHQNPLNCPTVSAGEILPTESWANPDDRRNRTDTLAELPSSTLNEAGIRPRLITDKYPFEVPFTICCWPGQEEISSPSPSATTSSSSTSSSCSPHKNFSNTEISIYSSDDNRPQSSSNVHSLTGRSLTKEFRELSAKNLPRIMNRLADQTSSTNKSESGISRTGSSAECSTPGHTTPCSPSNEGYTTDDSRPNEPGVSNDLNNTSCGLQQPQRGSKSGPRRMAPSILQKTSFWERRCGQESAS
ncbi:uncharacterized protein LOC141856591 isoform X3 [Brevipalpus obovatus]|uniref:uncharacterized protein LOC141856591 isoform X3 n=1 Tax=Brevipalpus obovatus TaxID=246614 RepID=UPI003D9F062C